MKSKVEREMDSLLCADCRHFLTLHNQKGCGLQKCECKKKVKS